MKNVKLNGLAAGGVLLAIAGLILLLLAVGPLLAIWALNTVSEQAALGWHIPHTVWTYLAVGVLLAIGKGSVSK